MYPFIIGNKYKRKDIYRIIGIIEDTKGGNWDTGYNKYKNDFFLFCNIGIPGRTGHRHADKFIGNDLIWVAKKGTHYNQPLMRELINPPGYVYIFYRTDQNSPFLYAGTAIPQKFVIDSSPFQIIWELTNDCYDIPFSNQEEKDIYEGARKNIKINIYERNPLARQICIEKHGTLCSVCNFNFEKVYGELGKNYIHVHHLIPLADLGENYQVDPVKDLIPVCPNCHAMLHRQKPPLTTKELSYILNNNRLEH